MSHSDANNLHKDVFDTVLDNMALALPGVDLTSVSISVRIGRLAGMFERAMEDALRPHGFGYGELEVLFFLLSVGKPYQMRPKELIKGCFVTGGAITGRVDRLQKLGIVTRVASLIDRREMVVQLTRSGERLGRRLQEVIARDSILAKILEQFTPETREGLDRTIRELLSSLEDYTANEERDIDARRASQAR